MDHKTVRLARVRALMDVYPGWRPVLWGELAGMPIVELLNILAQGRKTGLLLVRTPDGGEHALAVQDGGVHWADPIPRRETVDALVRLEAGTFTFVRAPGMKLDGEPTAMHELLLDALRRLDESSRDRLAG